MSSPILPKHNNMAGVVPVSTSLITNELAINTADAVAYVKHTDGSIKQIVDPTKAPLDSPTLIGVPTAPTAPVGTNSTQVATTEFVTIANSIKAPLESPALTGVPTAPTADVGTNTTQLATTEFVAKAGNSLQVQLDKKAPLDSPVFIGTPTGPTAPAGTSSTQLATTEFVTTADNLKAPLNSPAFTGTPTAPTAVAGTSTTQLATTAFVTAADNLKVDRDSATGAALLPMGTSAQRPVDGPGKLRFNTDLAKFEGHNGSAWGSLGGATGGGNDAVFYVNGQTVTANYTVPSGQNAMSAGPITIADGVTVTISDGSVWTVV